MHTTQNLAPQIRKQLPIDFVRQLHKVSTLRGVISIFWEWALIIITSLLCVNYFSWPLYIFTVVFIGARLLALGLLMHEAVHGLISKNKRLNDFLAELFCAWPLLISMRSYRIKHLAHHKWLNTDKDPDFVAKTDANWRFPMRVQRFVMILFVQLSGLGIFETFRVMSGKQVKLKKPSTPIWYHALRVLFYVFILGIFIYLGKGKLLFMYWFVPFATWTQVANRLRRVAEHSAVEDRDESMQTRTTTHGFLARVFLAPKYISLHNEHHLFPGVPCYYLPKLHAAFKNDSIAKEHLYMSKNYWAVFKDLLKSSDKKVEKA